MTDIEWEWFSRVVEIQESWQEAVIDGPEGYMDSIARQDEIQVSWGWDSVFSRAYDPNSQEQKDELDHLYELDLLHNHQPQFPLNNWGNEQEEVWEEAQESVPKSLSQEALKNQNEGKKEQDKVLEDLLEEPKRKKRKSNRRRKKTSFHPKGNLRLKRIKTIKKKLSSRLKATSRLKSRRRKSHTSMKVGTKKKVGIETVKRIDLKTHDPYLELVRKGRPCFNLYQRCEVYKAKVKSEEEQSTESQRIRRLSIEDFRG